MKSRLFVTSFDKKKKKKTFYGTIFFSRTKSVLRFIYRFKTDRTRDFSAIKHGAGHHTIPSKILFHFSLVTCKRQIECIMQIVLFCMCEDVTNKLQKKMSATMQ